MKTFVVCCLLLCVSVTNAQSLSFSAGRSFPSTDHLHVRYEHWTNGKVNLSLGAVYERSHNRLLNYSCYGADLLGEYATNREGYTGGVFGLRYGLGATAMIDSEPWLNKDLSSRKRLSYGLLGELGVEWFMTEHFTLRLGLQQKALFQSAMGHYRFLCALGLAWRLNNN